MTIENMIIVMKNESDYIERQMEGKCVNHPRLKAKACEATHQSG
jgi:hypothetical protein